MELKKTLYRLADDDPELKVWEERLAELGGTPDDLDELLGEIESRFNDDEQAGPRGQLELFGALLSDFVEHRRDDGGPMVEGATHRVVMEGIPFDGSWSEIVRQMRDSSADNDRTVEDYMKSQARRAFSRSGVRIPTDDAESFIRGSADAGLLRIVR